MNFGRSKRTTFVVVALVAVIVRSAMRYARGDRAWLWVSMGVESVIATTPRTAFLIADVAVLLGVGFFAIRRARDAGLMPAIGALFMVPGGMAFLPALLLPSSEDAPANELGPYRTVDGSRPHFIVRLLGGRERAATVGIGFVGVSLFVFGVPAALLSRRLVEFLSVPAAGVVAGAITHVIDPRADAAYRGRAWKMVIAAYLLAFEVPTLSYVVPTTFTERAFGTALVLAFTGIVIAVVTSLGTVVTAWIGRGVARRVFGTVSGR